MTHSGTVFKRYVDALPHEIDDGMAAASQLIEPETGTVALAFQQSLGTWLVADLVWTCRAAHPGARFQLTQVRDELQSATLDGAQADLEFGTPPRGPARLGATRRDRDPARWHPGQGVGRAETRTPTMSWCYLRSLAALGYSLIRP